MTINIDEIIIGKRIRKDLHDMDGLVNSMRNFGLLNPIVIDSDYKLIAGFRRLSAAKFLGWETIDVHIIKADNKIRHLELELEENIQRANFTHDELLEGYAKLEKLKNPSFLKKILLKIQGFFDKTFDKREARKKEKRRKNGFLSLFFIVGVLLIATSGILYKQAYISTVLLSLLNVVSFAFLMFGLFFFIRFMLGKPQN